MSLPSWVNEKFGHIERSLKEKSSNADVLTSLNRFADALKELGIIDTQYCDSHPAYNRWDNQWVDTGIKRDSDDGKTLWIKRAGS